MTLFSNGNPKTYWENAWDKYEGSNYEKALELLRQYSGGFNFTLTIDGAVSKTTFAHSFGRFIKGHWNSHHGEAVTEVLNAHVTFNSTYYDAHEDKRTVENILKDLNTALDSATLNPDGDLARILEVIKDKASVDNDSRFQPSLVL